MKTSIYVFLLLFLPFSVFSKEVWLDELDMQLMYQDWGNARVNQSIMGTPLQVAGINYKRGIGTHSISRYLVNLGGKARSFSGLVGADDRNDFSMNLEFQLIADQKVIWQSGVMHKGMPAKAFKVDLTNVQKLALLVLEAGDGIMYDHADWLEAKFETSGTVVPEQVIPTPIAIEKYILTPKPGDSPKINNAKVFGIRPGNPFLLTIAATGKRPMSFSVKDLPSGLNLDAQTGIISGTIEQRGTYVVVLRAENKQGSDKSDKTDGK